MCAPTARNATAREIRPLLRLALPIIAGLAASTVIGVVDTVMIAPLGTVPLAAASLTASALIILYSALYGFVAAAGVEASRCHGAENVFAVADALGASLRLALRVGGVSSVLMAAAFLLLDPLGQPAEVLDSGHSYWLAMALSLIPFTMLMAYGQFLNAIDRPWTAALLQFVMVALNVPFNYALIWGVGPLPALGLPGAGVGSMLAGLVAWWVTFTYVTRAPALAIYRRDRPIPPALARRLGLDGLPLAIGYMGEGAAFAVVGLMLGLFGASALAANQIVQSVGSLLYMLPLGMAAAVSIRVAQAEGAGAHRRLRPIATAAIGSVSLWMIVVTIGLVLGGRAIAEGLSDDAAVVSLATAMFIMIAIIQVADGVQSTALGALRGARDFRWPTGFTLACYWIFALPFAWLLGFTFGFGPLGVWAGYGAGIAVAAFVLPWRYWRLTRT